VVVLTRAHGARGGVRHMTNGLKVYYAPRRPVRRVQGAGRCGGARIRPRVR
jgi:hypothetical protein